MDRRRVRIAIVAVAAMFTGLLSAPAAQAAAPFEHIDHSAFTLDPAGTFGRYDAAIQRLEADPRIQRVSLESVVTAASPRRMGRWPLCHPTNLAAKYNPSGFCWDHDDDTSADWVPQGVTGSGDADPSGTVGGRRLVTASWHYTGDDFARLSIADYSKPSAGVPYHHLLLVEPYVDGSGRANFRPPENVHADGLMWYGDKLFVATGVRLQVYSLSHIWRMLTSGTDAGKIGLYPDGAHARWHGWALPLIGEYRTVWGPDGTWKSCASVTGSAPCMNAISLAPERNSFVTTEFYRPSAAGGRVVRWPLDPATGLPRAGSDRKVPATEAYKSPIWHMQGGATDGSAFYLTGDCPGTPTGDPNDWSCVHRALPDQEPHVLTKAPPLTQNLSYWPRTGELWGINERINTSAGKRVVFKIYPGE